jgi:heme oxygenase
MLREIVKKDTEEIHKKVEKSPIMSKIINKSIRPQEYYQYLIDIDNIYRTLYDKLKGTCLPHINHTNIQKDIELMKSKFGFEDISSSISCCSYCKYLKSIRCSTDDSISRIMAHVYTRYFADLSGGKILKRILAELEYPTHCYDFDGDIKDQLTDWINNKCVCPDSFKGECHVSFMCYDSILN